MSVKDLYIFGKNEGYIFRFDYLETKIEYNSNLSLTKTLTEKDQSVTDRKSQIRNSNMTLKQEKKSTLEEDINLNVEIDKNFLPDSNTNFILDNRKMSYILNPTNTKQLLENIKEDAINKITFHPTIKEEESVFSSSYNSSYSSNSFSNSKESDSNPENKNKPIDIILKRKKSFEEYYSVDFKNIKLLQYDHFRETITEIKEKITTSQVEYKKNEDHKRKKEMLEKKEQKIDMKNQEVIDEEEIEEFKVKEDILIKQIDSALNVEENQPTIIRMKNKSFIVFGLFLSAKIGFLIYFLTSISEIKEIIKLIEGSFTIILNTIQGIYHIRELTLINNPNYVLLYQIKDEYIKNQKESLMSLFTETHDLVMNIITPPIIFSEENYQKIYNYTINTYILEKDLNLKSTNSLLTSAILETNSALYDINHFDISKIIPTNKDVFFFMYNSLNNIYINLFKLVEVFINELNLKILNIENTFFYILISVLVICIFSYILILISYSEVGKRKESYLEVFFEIGGGVIKDSLEKCEEFTKKIQSDGDNEAANNIEEDNINSDANTSLVFNKKPKNNSSKKRKSNNSKEDKLIKLNIFIGMLIIFVVFCIGFLIFMNYLQILNKYVEIYNVNCNEQAYFLVLYNILREYFFDSKTEVQGENISNFMENSIKNIYKYKLEKENVKIFLFNF